MASFEFLAIIVSVLGLAASITYYATVLNNANTTRQAQLLLNIYDKFSSQAPLHERNIYKLNMTIYEDGQQIFDDQELYKSFAFFNSFFEGVGVFIREGYLEIGDILVNNDRIAYILQIWPLCIPGNAI